MPDPPSEEEENGNQACKDQSPVRVQEGALDPVRPEQQRVDEAAAAIAILTTAGDRRRRSHDEHSIELTGKLKPVQV